MSAKVNVTNKAPIGKPYAFNKLDNNEKDKVFLNLYEENTHLKQNEEQLQQEFK